jgi:hypothetical protein
MTDISRIRSADAVVHGVLKIVWFDGFEAVVDLRPVIARGGMFEFLRKSPDRFRAVKVEEYGHSIFWLDDDGDEIDFGSDSLRRRAEQQAEVLRHAG